MRWGVDVVSTGAAGLGESMVAAEQDSEQQLDCRSLYQV